MNKKLFIYLGVFIVVIGLMMYLEYAKPKPIDWTPSYSSKDKIPLGTYILGKEIIKLFPEKEVQFIEETPASFFSYFNDVDFENIEKQTYFIIDETPNLSDTDINTLLSFVKNGNNVFLVAKNIPSTLKDSLKIDIGVSNFILNKDFTNVTLYLVNHKFKNKNYKFEKITNYSYFKKLNNHSIILGEYETSLSKEVNFIKQNYGKGSFYIQLFPEGYSNYFMLNNENYTYAVNTLNYINTPIILWDENNKSINQSNDGILKYIISNPPLHWAWIILIVSAIFYCLFFGKRLQRIIPIISPLKNTTVEFTKTIGNLYYNNKEHQDIINKKIKYFLYFVKEHYFMNIENIDKEFSEKLHLKSGVPQNITDQIVTLIQKNKFQNFHSEKELENINRIIDIFYKKTK